MNRAWRDTMRCIYNFVGMEFDVHVEQAMDEWLVLSDRQGQHGSHRYTLEDFGLTRPQVEARMMFVREKYAIQFEG